jgi:hypothetical protein
MHIAVARLTFSGEQSGSRRAVTNARAEALLDQQAIEYEREPSWIEKGQKPDFYCHGHPNFWCEVKTLERLPDSKELEAALAELRSRTSNIPQPGFGIAYIDSGFDHREAKAVRGASGRQVPRPIRDLFPSVRIEHGLARRIRGDA